MTEAETRAVLELDPRAITRTINTAVAVSSEIVSFHLTALSVADLSKPSDGLGFLRFKGPSWNEQQRRAVHENWILARGFQELLRAVRHGLEVAHVIATLVTKREQQVKSDTTVAEFLRPYEERANKLLFPDLLAEVNEKLALKLDFADAYQSLQTARNCLEHRSGIIGIRDVRGDERFELATPRMKIFYMRDNNEVELAQNETVDPGNDDAEVQILGRIEVRRRLLGLGERLTFTRSEFNEIAFACHYLGQQLIAKLPKPAIGSSTTSPSASSSPSAQN
jgi:hypothetical protein